MSLVCPICGTKTGNESRCCPQCGLPLSTKDDYVDDGAYLQLGPNSRAANEPSKRETGASPGIPGLQQQASGFEEPLQESWLDAALQPREVLAEALPVDAPAQSLGDAQIRESQAAEAAAPEDLQLEAEQAAQEGPKAQAASAQQQDMPAEEAAQPEVVQEVEAAEEGEAAQAAQEAGKAEAAQAEANAETDREAQGEEAAADGEAAEGEAGEEPREQQTQEGKAAESTEGGEGGEGAEEPQGDQDSEASEESEEGSEASEQPEASEGSEEGSEDPEQPEGSEEPGEGSEKPEGESEGESEQPEGESEESDVPLSESPTQRIDSGKGKQGSKITDKFKKLDSMLEGTHGQAAGIDREAATVVFPAVSNRADATGVIPSIRSNSGNYYGEQSAIGKRIGAKHIALLVVLALVVVAAVVFALRSCSSSVSVPDVVGMTTQEARLKMDAAGFTVEVQSKVSKNSHGIVLETDPKAGAKRAQGSTVVLTVSASLTVPDVVGMDLASASDLLKEEGATNIAVKAEASNQPENTVIAVSPETGQAFDPADEIVLTVATSATVPDVVGLQSEDAKAQLEETGYAVEINWIAPAEGQTKGEVLSSNPAAGELANLGSTVSLEVVAPGPSDELDIMGYFNDTPQNISAFMNWKQMKLTGSYKYNSEWTGTEYVSEIWEDSAGDTISFTPAPFNEDKGLDMVDYLAEGTAFQGLRLYIPKDSPLSKSNEVSMTAVKEYMDACKLDNLTDSCDEANVVQSSSGATGAQLGLGNFVCAEGITDGRVWTILLTEKGAYIGAGDYECYNDMYPICDEVAVMEMYTSEKK